MADINALVVASTEIIEKARLLDTNYDLWSARMIRWVQFGFPIKSLVCGVKWEDQQDYDHAYETLAEWRNYYLAGYPEEATERNLPTYSTGSMSSQALRDRDWYRARAREQAIIVSVHLDMQIEILTWIRENKLRDFLLTKKNKKFMTFGAKSRRSVKLLSKLLLRTKLKFPKTMTLQLL